MFAVAINGHDMQIPDFRASRGAPQSPQIAPLNLATALALADAGIPVYPVEITKFGNKCPLIKDQFNVATTDPERITRWFNRWPHALAGIPTGPISGLWVLDVDGPKGRESLNELLAKLGLEQVADLSNVIVRTPRGGLHIYFRLRNGEEPRSRASDIASGLDTRAAGGGIIAPGNTLTDGRSYQFINPIDFNDVSFDLSRLREAPGAPRSLLYLATFKHRDRQLISETPALQERIRAAESGAWRGILDDWYVEEASNAAARCRYGDDPEGYRAQARSDLTAAAAEYAALSDGRRTGLFQITCKVAKYAAHGYLTELHLHSAFLDAARNNGALATHGMTWAVNTIRGAIKASERDALPPLARQFRTNGGRV